MSWPVELKAEPGKCEEASPLSHKFYIPCNRTAEYLMRSDKDRRIYRMCLMCADHNTRRGMVNIGEYHGDTDQERREHTAFNVQHRA